MRMVRGRMRWITICLRPVQSLGTGDTLTDTVTVTSVDGTDAGCRDYDQWCGWATNVAHQSTGRTKFLGDALDYPTLEAGFESDLIYSIAMFILRYKLS